MPDRPLSRDESQERTRRLLVDAAATLFERDGYRVTSLADVAAAAGFSKGAVYSNFAGKEHLFLATVEDEYVGLISTLRAALADGGDIEVRLRTLGSWYVDNVAGPPQPARALAEFALAPAAHGEVRGRLAALRRMLASVVEDVLAEQQQELGITFRVAVPELAQIVLALVDGLVVQDSFDPAPPDRFATAMALLLSPA